MSECTRFDQRSGCKTIQTIRLWTDSMLVAARCNHQKAGYRLLASEPHHSFGHALVGEVRELRLR